MKRLLMMGSFVIYFMVTSPKESNASWTLHLEFFYDVDFLGKNFQRFYLQFLVKAKKDPLWFIK
jgi:hypothetical protein